MSAVSPSPWLPRLPAAPVTMMKKLRRRLSLTLHSKRGATHTSGAAGAGVGNTVGGISRARTLSEDRLDYLSDIAERQLTIDDLANALTEQDEEEEEEDDTIDLDAAPQKDKKGEGKEELRGSKKQLHHHNQKEAHSQQQHQYYYYHSHQHHHHQQRFRPLSSGGTGGLHHQQYQPYHHSQPQLNQLRVPSLSSAASLQEGDPADLTEDSSPLSGSADVISPFRANGESSPPTVAG